MMPDDLDELKALIKDIASRLEQQTKVEEIQMKNHINMILEMRNDIKSLKDFQSSQMLQVQEHIENKLSICNARMTDILEKKYMTKAEIEAFSAKVVETQTQRRTSEINGLRKRLEHEFEEKIQNVESKARLLAWAAGTVMGVITTIIGAILTLKKLF